MLLIYRIGKDGSCSITFRLQSDNGSLRRYELIDRLSDYRHEYDTRIDNLMNRSAMNTHRYNCFGYGIHL